MQEQFVTYEIAKELKELGFSEDCFAYWYGEDELIFCNSSSIAIYPFKTQRDDDSATAPIWQQAVDWFRKEHNLSIEIAVGENMWEYNIMSIIGFDVQICSGIVFSSCEDARKQGILKSIELCKNKK